MFDPSGKPAALQAEEHAGTRTDERRSTRTRILDTAEELFSRHGYYGTSIRDITQACGVELSLARYHFGTKDELFREAIARRAEAISLEVIASLDARQAALAQTGAGLGVEAIVLALSEPAFRHLASGDPGWRNYVRLLTQTGGLLERPDLRAPFYACYAPARQRYKDVLIAAIPGCSDELGERVLGLVDAVFNQVLDELYLHESQTGKTTPDHHLARLRRHLVCFAVGGILALAQSEHD